ncbi:MAG: hypothetical protein A2583_07215 [Bdellovibrionales bacterium RIFOXYD1_FULL_53_11]|nr:MAG: hypothetical protein A2583_07215 [Bdellovibrionales bacterium RIFOXYD1_FULL_53_11]
MGKIRRGGYVFIFWKGDHTPKHVHIFCNNREIAKWNIQDWALMGGSINMKIYKILLELEKEGGFEEYENQSG